MPDKIIEIPNVGRIAFPDSMTPDQMNAAAAKLYAEKNPSHPKPDLKHSWMDTAVDWLPTAGGVVGGIVGGIGGTAFGMGVGGVPGAVGGAALGGGTGEAARQIINEFRGKPVPTMGQAATGLATQAAVQGGAEVLGAGAGAVLSRVGPALMQSAVKPGLKATAKAFARGVEPAEMPIVKTLLKEGVNVTPGGIAKLDRLINASNDEIAAALTSAPGSVYPEAVAGRVDNVVARASKQVNPTADVKAAKDSAAEFLKTQRGSPTFPATPLSLADAQALKTGTYRALKEKAYGEVKAPAIEAQKALARGLKEDIEAEAAKAGYDISTANAREGAAITAKEAIAKRLAAAGNRDPVSLAWLAHNPTAGLLFLLERSPAVKSLLARGSYNAASSVAKVSPQVLKVMLGALATSEEDQP